MHPHELIICKRCDSVHRRATIAARERAGCLRCGAELYRNNRYDLDSMLALTLASLILFIIGNIYPLMTLEVNGRRNAATLWQTITATWHTDVAPIAIVAATTVFFFPLLQIILFTYVLLPLRSGRVPSLFLPAVHALHQMQPWTMVEVFVLGTLVAVAKLGALAVTRPELGMWLFAALTLLLTMLHSYDLRELWEQAAAIESGGSA